LCCGLRNLSGKLVAFASYKQLPVDYKLNYLINNLDLNKTPYYLGGAVVDEDYRGNGFQLILLNFRLKQLKLTCPSGFNAWITAHPENIVSIRNIEKAGFKKITDKPIPMYGSVRDVFFI